MTNLDSIRTLLWAILTDKWRQFEMDVQTGKLYDKSIIQQLINDGAIVDKSRFKQLKVSPTEAQVKRKRPRIGRNDPCPCGSGGKFKKCCFRPVDKRFQ